MTYDLTFLSNSSSIVSIWTGINDQSGGWFIGFLLFTLYLVFFMTFMNGYNFKDVFFADSFFLTAAAGLLFGMGLVATWVISLSVALLAISLFVKIWGDG